MRWNGIVKWLSRFELDTCELECFVTLFTDHVCRCRSSAQADVAVSWHSSSDHYDESTAMDRKHTGILHRRPHHQLFYRARPTSSVESTGERRSFGIEFILHRDIRDGRRRHVRHVSKTQVARRTACDNEACLYARICLCVAIQLSVHTCA